MMEDTTKRIFEPKAIAGGQVYPQTPRVFRKCVAKGVKGVILENTGFAGVMCLFSFNNGEPHSWVMYSI